MGTKTTTAAANNEKLKTMIHMRGGEVVGRAVMRKLSEVKANSWNPNKMDDAMMESLKFGLINDGWLASQALLIWHTDEKGKTQDVIIDGEHRWSAASEIGFVKGPMVMLDGLTEAKAKALTIKMNQKRGEFQKDSLAELMSSLQTELDVSTMGIELGFSDDMVMKLLASQAFEQEEEKKPRTPPEMSRGLSEHAKSVQLFFDEAGYDEFMQIVHVSAEKFGTSTISETVFAVLKASAKKAKAAKA